MNNITEKLNLGVHVDDILCLGTKNAVETWFHTITLLSIYKSVPFWLCRLTMIDFAEIITISQPSYI